MTRQERSLLRAKNQRIKELRSRVRTLERALRPFAREATGWLHTVSDGYHPGVTEPRQRQVYGKAVFTIGDLRRAYRLVATA